jgi:uncharacterized membrane protein YdbT with pleckstrin-like domain
MIGCLLCFLLEICLKIPREKFYTYTQNLFQLVLQSVGISLLAVGNTKSKSKQDMARLFPYFPKKQASCFLKQLLPAYCIQWDKKGHFQKKMLFMKLITPWYIYSVAAFVWMVTSIRWGLIILLLLISICSVIQYLDYRNTYIAIHPQTLFVHKGVFKKRSLITLRSNVISVQLKQSWLQQIVGTADITVKNHSNKIVETTVYDVPYDQALAVQKWFYARNTTMS